MPRVAICIPSGRTWEVDMAMSLVSLVRETSDLDLAVLSLTGSQITVQRNMLVKRAMDDYGAEYIFWLDSDIKGPPSMLHELLGHRKDIVGATYCKKIEPFEMLGKLERGVGRLKPAKLMPGGCLLVKTDVYRTIGWPYYFEQYAPPAMTWQEGSTTSEDYSFCEKVLKNGFDIWCDLQLSQRIAHIGQQSISMQLREGHPDRYEGPKQ